MSTTWFVSVDAKQVAELLRKEFLPGCPPQGAELSMRCDGSYVAPDHKICVEFTLVKNLLTTETDDG